MAVHRAGEVGGIRADNYFGYNFLNTTRIVLLETVPLICKAETGVNGYNLINEVIAKRDEGKILRRGTKICRGDCNGKLCVFVWIY